MKYSVDIIMAPDFSNDEIKVGTLGYERIKGGAAYLFELDDGFMKKLPHVTLSSDLRPYPGIQASAEGIFRFLADAMPDRWGKALIDKRERLTAAVENRQPRSFDDFQYMIRVDDRTRMGALRFRYNGKYIGAGSERFPVPIISDIPEIIRKSQEYEKGEHNGTETPLEWIENLWAQGSSLGGARPKANVLDEKGTLCIAKVPSVNDTYDIALWEHFAHQLARRCGLSSAKTRILKLGNSPYHTLLSERFDRDAGKRIHFASAISLAGLKDGDGASTGKGYIDIAEAIVGDAGIQNPGQNLSELFGRIAFNICIGNHDDHFRNHGFLLRKEGWVLSPTYDLNPTNAFSQSLLISPTSNRSSLKELLAASDYYLIEKGEAEIIVERVLEGTSKWRAVAKNVGINEKEQNRFASRFDAALSEMTKTSIRKTGSDERKKQYNGPKR